MKRRSQLVRWTLALLVCGGVSLPVVAQKDRPPAPAPRAQRPANPPKNNPNRPPAGQSRPAQQQRAERQADRQNQANRNLTPRQQLGVGAARPWLQTMREATPSQRERFFQNSSTFRNFPPEKQQRIRENLNRWDRLTPQQKADQMEKERNWQTLSRGEKEHIRNDVLPAWRQMPKDRQDAIQHRLGILKNMPESARNQRLNDPKFTAGMSDEDKSMLRDLSHMHIGGAPDPPNE